MKEQIKVHAAFYDVDFAVIGGYDEGNDMIQLKECHGTVLRVSGFNGWKEQIYLGKEDGEDNFKLAFYREDEEGSRMLLFD